MVGISNNIQRSKAVYASIGIRTRAALRALKFIINDSESRPHDGSFLASYARPRQNRNVFNITNKATVRRGKPIRWTEARPFARVSLFVI